MASRGSLVIRFIGDMKEFDRSTKSLAGKLNKTGKSMTRGVTLPIAAVGVSMLKSAGDFEAGMNKVSAITGATGSDLDAMREQAKELGSSTKFSASEAAEAMSFLGMAGFDTKETMAAMPGVLNLAAASGTDLATSADIASNVLSGFGASAGDAGKFADLMAKTTASANTDVVQLGEAMKMVAPIAASAGVSVEETSAIIGKLGDAGIQGSMAGTTLRSAISRLLDPSAKAQKALKGLGVSATDGEGNLRPMAKIVEELGKKGASTSDLMQIFGQRAGPGMAALVSAGGPAIRELTGELEGAGGTAQEMADIQMQGLNGALTELKSAWEGLMISFAESGALEIVTGLVKDLTGQFRKFSDLGDGTKKTIMAFAVGAALLGPLLIVVSKLIKLFAATVKAAVMVGKALLTVGKAALWSAKMMGRLLVSMVRFAAIGIAKTAIMLGKGLILLGKAALFAGKQFLRMTVMMLTNPFVLIAAAVILLGIVIFKNWDKIVAATKKAWNWVVGFLKKHGLKILAILAGPIGILVGLIIKHWSSIKKGTQKVWSAIVGFVKKIPGLLLKFFLNWSLPGLIIKHWDSIKSGTIKVATSIVNWVKGLPGKFVAALSRLGSMLLNVARTGFDKLRSGAVDKVTMLMNVARGIPDRIKSALGDLGSLLLNAGKALIQGLISGITSKLADLGSAMGKVGGKIKGFLPGSPIREGPLQSWNNGAAGRRLMDLLALGITNVPVTRAMDRALSEVAVPRLSAPRFSVDGRSPMDSTGAGRPAPQVHNHFPATDEAAAQAAARRFAQVLGA